MSVHDIAAINRATGIPYSWIQRFLAEAPPEQSRRVVLAAETQRAGILHDPIEDEAEYREAIAAARAEAHEIIRHRRETGEAPPDRTISIYPCVPMSGLSYETKRILRERFGIEWYSMEEMNVGSFFHFREPEGGAQ